MDSMSDEDGSLGLSQLRLLSAINAIDDINIHDCRNRYSRVHLNDILSQ